MGSGSQSSLSILWLIPFASVIEMAALGCLVISDLVLTWEALRLAGGVRIRSDSVPLVVDRIRVTLAVLPLRKARPLPPLPEGLLPDIDVALIISLNTLSPNCDRFWIEYLRTSIDCHTPNS